MIFDPAISQRRIGEIRSRGQWPDRIMTDYMDENLARAADRVAIVDYNSMTGLATTLSYRQLGRIADRIALGLVQRGIEPGDVVSCQLPNWWQLAALYLACVRIGAAINPLMPIFRQREMSFMLGFCEAKALVIPKVFRGFDYAGMIADLRGDLPALEQVWIIGSDDNDSDFDANLVQHRWEEELDGPAIFRERRPQPDDVTLLLYTSGTTGQPKGVMHTGNTLMLSAHNIMTHLRMTSDDIIFMPSPLAHITGFFIGLVMPIQMGSKAVLQDQWNPALAAQWIQDEGATMTSGAPAFMADLTDHPGVAQYDTSSLRRFHTGGAPVPRILVKKAHEKLDLLVTTAWGMTETGLVTATAEGEPPEKLFNTDGKAVLEMDVRIVDDNNRIVAADMEGRLQCRCASLFVGYLKRPQDYGVDDEGWFETGDNARMDADGYIRITGRSKDIIIRGGENIPVVEVEELLYRHPAVADAAIVAMPDERLGERGCAYVVTRDGGRFEFQEMLDYLGAQGLTRNYLPERLEIIPEMPRTPSGKIQKFKLREMAAELPL